MFDLKEHIKTFLDNEEVGKLSFALFVLNLIQATNNLPLVADTLTEIDDERSLTVIRKKKHLKLVE